jgi:benzoyl-CoA reductase/2-hydroxyglutaryl-CoA dehydratase subunit BcrC/BadD/HgdB
MKTILYTSPFVPPEWIEACGFRPKRLVPAATVSAGDSSPSQGVCHFAWLSAEEAKKDAEAAGMVYTTICDQMRRVREGGSASTFLLHVPKTWQHANAFEFYLDELRRLSGFLREIGGRFPEDEELRGVMRAFEVKRMSLLALRTSLAPRQFSEALLQFHVRCVVNPTPVSNRSRRQSIPVALVGGPLTWDDYSLFDEVERAGGTIVLDGTENGERTLPALFDPRRREEDPLGELGRAYFLTIPDVFRRPNGALFEWLRQNVAARTVRGIILVRNVWCDLWHAEVSRIREAVQVPVLDLDVDGAKIADRNRTRVQAFIEMLQ